MANHKNLRYTKKRAHRTEQSGSSRTTAVIVGDKFKYKEYACTVDSVTKNIIMFTGRKRESEREMFLNIDSFYDALENKRIVMTRFGGKSVASDK